VNFYKKAKNYDVKERFLTAELRKIVFEFRFWELPGFGFE